MNFAEELAVGYRRNSRYLSNVLEGFDHERSLAQVPGNNCLNWTLGHIVKHRNIVLDLVGAPILGPNLERYANESEPVTADGPGVVDFSELVELLVESGEVMHVVLGGLTTEELDRTVEIRGKDVAVGSRANFFFFHDTLHVGQADALAHLAK